MKAILSILPAPGQHWVGDGFPVRSMFSPRTLGEFISPFILMDYAGPFETPPTDHPRGVDVHPHRGFETVTVVYQGEVEHRDSAGNAGKIGPGDVQWMTAASGVVHEEKHGREFAARGGTLEMAQIWVNLPAKAKMSAPRYQEILAKAIPTVDLLNRAGAVRVVAGDFSGTPGATRTVTPLNLWDVSLKSGGVADLPVPAGHNTLLFMVRGRVHFPDGQSAGTTQLVVLGRDENGVSLQADEDSSAILLSGEPIDEPMVAHGPFVMNTQAEIRQAIEDYQSGRMGTL